MVNFSNTKTAKSLECVLLHQTFPCWYWIPKEDQRLFNPSLAQTIEFKINKIPFSFFDGFPVIPANVLRQTFKNWSCYFVWYSIDTFSFKLHLPTRSATTAIQLRCTTGNILEGVFSYKGLVITCGEPWSSNKNTASHCFCSSGWIFL